jgi:hypothetical protein
MGNQIAAGKDVVRGGNVVTGFIPKIREPQQRPVRDQQKKKNKSEKGDPANQTPPPGG